MEYSKPQVLLLGEPTNLVRSHRVKNIASCLDSDGSNKDNATCNAYEADE